MKNDYEVTIEYDSYRIIDKKLCLIYNVNVTEFEEELKGSSLKKELENLIPKKDKKFISVYKYDKKKVIYVFEANKWFDTSSKRIVATEDRYSKRIELKLLPTMVSNNISFVVSTKVVEESFRNYLIKNSDFRKKIQSCIVKDDKLSHYTYQYDSNQSFILITLKPQFRTNILISIKRKKAKLNKTNFDETVATILKI